MRLKNYKFFGKRGLSVLLSLVLCMGMASPAFAASFSELQGAIDTGNSVYQEGKNADSPGEGAEKYKIEASNDENSISVKLWEDVECNKASYDWGICIYRDSNDGHIIDERDVTLDLNGKTIDLNPGYTLEEGTFKDKDGKEAAPGDLKDCPVIDVWNRNLTINDSSAQFTEDAEGNRQYIAGTGTGKITGGYIGGVSVSGDSSSFTMNGGSITGNRSPHAGGGIDSYLGDITLNGVTVSGNYADIGGGLYVGATSDVTIKGSVISGNHATTGKGLGGGIFAPCGDAGDKTTIDISKSVIEGNTANKGGGIYAERSVSITMRETELNKNESVDAAEENGSAIHAVGGIGKWRRPQISLTDVSFNENVSHGDNGSTLYLYRADVAIDIGTDQQSAYVTVSKGDKLIDKEHNSETIYPDGATITKSGNGVESTGSSVTKTVDEKNSTVTIVTNNGTKDTSNNTFQVTDPKQVVVDRKDGTTTIPGSSKTTVENSETTYPKGAEIDINGSIKGDSVTKTDNADGTITIINKAGEDEKTHKVEVAEENKGDVKVDSEGNTTLPAGSKVTDESGSETPYPDGATIDAQGNITAKGHDYQLKEIKDATCTEAGSRIEVCTICGDTKVTTTPALEHDYQVTETKAASCTEASSKTEVCSRCKDEKVTTTDPALDHDYTVTGHEDASCMENGFTTETCTRCQDEKTTVIEAPGHTEEIIPAVPATETESGWTEGIRCSECGEVLRAPVEIPATGPVNPENPEQPETPETPDVPGGDVDFGDDGAGTATIAEQDVPLAGIVLVKDVLAELYKHEGSPDGEDAEGEYVKAIAWAIANGIVAEDADVDAVVTVAVLKEMLTNYAASVGGVLTVSIDGEDDDVVMNCGEILAKVFETL